MTTQIEADNVSRPQGWLDRAAGPAMIIVALLVPVIVVNPFREMTVQDDSWAYARMVQHLLATGRYQLDSWTAANMPVQIYLAAGLSKIFGYSLSLLRISTLALLLAGLLSFYALLRELTFSKTTASVLTIALLASPLTLLLGFSFMSDAQYLAWALLALWLYVRSMRRNSMPGMFLASLAAGCAIGTRQFGMAIPAGLLLGWMVAGRERRPPARLLAAGIAVPVVAAGLQLYAGLAAPSFTQIVRMEQQHELFQQPAVILLREFYWRCALILQYVGMAMLPVLPLAVFAFRRRSGFSSRRTLIAMTILAGVGIVAALVMSSLFSEQPANEEKSWQAFQMYWILWFNLRDQFQEGPRHIFMHLLAFAGVVGGAALFGLCWQQALAAWKQRRPSAEWSFLASTAVAMLALQVVYVQLWDTYILAFIPFGLLVVARGEREGNLTKRALLWSAGASAVIIMLMSLHIRSMDSRQEALWQASEVLVQSGVPQDVIFAPIQWQEYHGAFDQWLADGTPGSPHPIKGFSRYSDPFHAPFIKWITARNIAAEYWVGLYLPDAGWQPLATCAYRDKYFRRRLVWVLRKTPSPETAATGVTSK